MAEGKIGWPGLLAALEQGDEQVARTARRWRRFIALAMFILCLLTVACIGWVLIELRDAWDTGRWWYFWQTVIGPFLMVTYGAPVLSVGDPFTRYADAARKIREAAIRGDEQDAPVAQENSQLYPDSNALFGGISYGPLKRPNDARGAVLVALLFVAVLIAITLGVVMLAVGVSGAGEVTTQQEEIVGGIILLLLLFSIGSLVVFLRMRRDIVVVADDIGITWKREGWRTQSRSIAWTDVRAFFVITRQSSTHSAKETTWVLMGSSGTLTWRDPQESTSQADTPHAQFAALVAARTRLPLRDLSALANRVTSTQFTTERREAILAALNAAATRQEQREVWRSLLESEQPTKPGCLGRGCTMQLVLVIVFAVLYAGGWGLEQYQPHYYEGMLVQIHASKPLYHDDMAYDNGDWPLCAPTVDNPDRCTYEGPSYHLTGVSGRFVPAWSASMYGNAVVEGTVAQIGSAEYDGVGLILRAFDDKHEMVVFFIHPTDGTWSLAHYRDVGGSSDDNWTAFENGSSRAIRTEQGAANDLLVIMAGDRYICYINGKLVLSYDDSEHVIPRTGHAGFYVNDGVTEGVFTNFTVYPAPPPSIWSAL